MNRIDRLSAILIQLQSKRIVKAEEIAERFEISLRTVYRDVKALMEGGVPIGSEAGKGYFIVEGYHLPPVQFNEEEANALLMAGKLVEKMTDHSIRKAYESALMKIKSVLHETQKDHLESLQGAMEVHQSISQGDPELPNDFLTVIQKALAGKEILSMEYFSSQNKELTARDIEPIGIVYYRMNWHLIAWCRLRNGYRDFRADRIKNVICRGEKFDSRNLLSLQEYFQSFLQANQDVTRAIVTFRKESLSGRPMWGSISQRDLGDRIEVTFLSGNLSYLAKWLLMYGTCAEVEEPEQLKNIMTEAAAELYAHYSKVSVSN